MAKSRGRKFAEITSPTSGVFDLTSVPTITNAKLQNSAMTLAGSSVSLGGTGVANTDALSEGSSNLYFTNARVQSFLGGGTLAGNIVVPDNQSIYLGSSSDFRLVHNTTNTQLTNSTGELQITSNGGVAVTGDTTIKSGNKLIINRADNATGGEITYGPTGTGFIFNDVNGDDTIFKTGSTEHMRIDAATSRVGIGTIAPNQLLDIEDGHIRLTPAYGIRWEDDDGTYRGQFSTNSSYDLQYYAQSDGSSPAFVIDNGTRTVGIGTTDIHTWSTFDGRLRIGARGFFGTTTGSNQMGYNWYYDGAYKYIAADFANRYYQNGGNHVWETAASGSADGTITWSGKMLIDSSGNVGIGNTSPLQAHTQGITIGPRTILSDVVSYQTLLANNAYYKTGNVWKSIVATGGGYSAIRMYNGAFRVHTGTVSAADQTLSNMDGTDIRLHVGSDGRVGIGTTGPSAPLDVVGGGTSVTPTLELNSSTSDLFNHAVNAFNSSLTAGENNIFIIGKEGSTKNSGYIGYKWNSAGSNTNAVTFGHWSSDNLMNLTADGRLGIGTQTPASYDTNSGGISADLVVANSGHAGIVVASGTSSDAGIFFGDGPGNAAYRGAVSYVNSQERMYFKASGGNYLTLDNTRLNAMGINLDVGVDTATVNFTDSVSNGNTKYIEIGANGSSSLGDALLVTHSSGSGVGYFGYESGNDRLIIACDNGGGNNTIEFSVNAGTATGGTTDNLNGATAALTILASEVVTTAKHVRQLGAPGFKVKNHGFTKGVGWTHIGASITTVDYNNNSSGWSSSNGRFTPTRAGYYLFSFGGWANASTNGARYATSFAKNNSLTYISGGDYCSVDSPLNGHSEVIYMNGSTDYVQLYAYSAISCTWGTSSHAAWWSAVWLH